MALFNSGFKLTEIYANDYWWDIYYETKKSGYQMKDDFCFDLILLR